MIYVGIDVQGNPVKVVNSLQETLDNSAGIEYWQSRHDWTDNDVVAETARLLSEATNELYIAVDKGNFVSPRYDIIKAPKVGDEVSMGFNGDYYPVGKIESISDTMRVIVAGGKMFYRKRQTGAWLYSKTFTLIPGTRDERNPSF